MNATDPKIETPQLVATADLFGGTLIGELMRLDKIISDCAESILLAERLKARGGWEKPWDNELAALREKLAKALREREWLDGAIEAASASLQNTRGDT